MNINELPGSIYEYSSSFPDDDGFMPGDKIIILAVGIYNDGYFSMNVCRLQDLKQITTTKWLENSFIYRFKKHV